MKKFLTAIMMLTSMGLLIACGGSETPGEDPLIIIPTRPGEGGGTVEVVDPAATATAPVSDPGTVEPSPTPAESAAGNPTPTPRAACVVNDSWPTYTVQAGDTLLRLAQRTGGTVDEIVAANCLLNPNLLEIGMTLRVPQVPATVTPAPSPTPELVNAPESGVVDIHGCVPEALSGLDVCGLQVDEPVSVTWSAIGTQWDNILQVEFVLTPEDGGAAVSIGIDETAADGWSTSWTVPGEATGTVTAVGYLLGQDQQRVVSPPLRVEGVALDECYFLAYGIGGAVPVLAEPEIDAAERVYVDGSKWYDVLQQGGSWTSSNGDQTLSGRFYQIQVEEQSGWVQDVRGMVRGACTAVPTLRPEIVWERRTLGQFEVRLDVPADWSMTSNTNGSAVFTSADGFIRVTPAGAVDTTSDSLADYAAAEIGSGANRPFGTDPQVLEVALMDGRTGILILPSANQPIGMNNGALILAAYDEPLTLNGITYRFARVAVHKDFVRAVAESLSVLQ